MKREPMFWVWCLALAFGATACAKEIGAPLADSNDASSASGDGTNTHDGGMDGGLFGNFNHTKVHPVLDAGPTGDAFFVNDPPPEYCGPEAGAPSTDDVTGTVQCPSDKNREGCPCKDRGATQPCWPGKRAQRNRGVCQDGMSKCIDSVEFGLRWGACEGYVLPDETAVAGPKACGCFSAGTWSLSNLSPCIQSSDTTGKTYMYSSLRTLNADGSINCGTAVPEPPTLPPEAWSASALNVDCAGQFNLCYTIKAGDVKNPQPGDCTISQSCQDVWYAESGKEQKLPDLGAWRSLNSDCAAQFVARGGYGEMSVDGTSVDCDVVNDGKGNPLVFHRIGYCKPSCNDTPDTPECKDCRIGGSGDFSN